MGAQPFVLDYVRPPPPPWRVYGRWAAGSVAVLVALVGSWWVIQTTWASWGRYITQKEYEAGHTALSGYVIPAGTVVLNPSSGPMAIMKPYSNEYGHGSCMTLQIPNDGVIEANLQRMRRFDWLCAYAFAAERKTTHGIAFVRAWIDTSSRLTASDPMSLFIAEEIWTPGQFPFYYFRTYAWISVVHFLPSKGHTQPTVLAARAEANPASWTLPLIVDGRSEWLRFDHTGNTLNITTSFGQIAPGHQPFELRF